MSWAGELVKKMREDARLRNSGELQVFDVVPKQVQTVPVSDAEIDEVVIDILNEVAIEDVSEANNVVTSTKLGIEVSEIPLEISDVSRSSFRRMLEDVSETKIDWEACHS